jgi:hypothetical protein
VAARFSAEPGSSGSAPRAARRKIALIAFDRVLARGKTGYEGFDSQERSLGLFKTASVAANAISEAAESERGAG